MFLPEVTNMRSPTTLAPAVRPMSCLIEPRYSTLSDMTASGSAAEAGATRHSREMAASRAARSALVMQAGTPAAPETCGSAPEHVRRGRLPGRHDARAGREREVAR